MVSYYTNLLTFQLVSFLIVFFLSTNKLVNFSTNLNQSFPDKVVQMNDTKILFFVSYYYQLVNIILA